MHSVKNDRQGFFMLGLSVTVFSTSILSIFLFLFILLLLESIEKDGRSPLLYALSCQLNKSLCRFIQKGAKNAL